MKLVNAYKPFLILYLFLFISKTGNTQVWTLQKCIDTALVRNMNLQIGRNNILISEKKSREAKGHLLPKISVNADYKYFINLPYQLMPLSTFNPAAPEGQFKEAQFGVPHNISANVQFVLPIYNPHFFGAINNTKIGSEIKSLEFQKSEEQVYFEIANLYYNAQILYHQLSFIDSNLINSQRLLKNTQLLSEQKLIKGSDVVKMKLQVAKLSSQKESVSYKFQQVLNMMKFNMGIPLEENLDIDSTIQYKEMNEIIPSKTVEYRLIKSQNQFLSNELNTLVQSRFLPSINLIGMYGFSGFGYDKKPDDFLKFYPTSFAGVQLAYPIFNGSITQQKIMQKRIEIQNNELQIGMLNDKTKMQVENAKMQRRITFKNIELANQEIAMAKMIYQQTVLQHVQGLANLNDVLLADQSLREAQQIYLTAIIDYLKADLELNKLMGNMLPFK